MKVAVGIDVSKKDLEAALMRHSQKVATRTFHNDAQGHDALLAWATRHAAGGGLHFCMESTGPYHLALARRLWAAGALVSVINPRQVKRFVGAKDLRNKTDKVDAKAIAEFTLCFEPRAWEPRPEPFAELSDLRKRLKQLHRLEGAEANRLENGHLSPLVLGQIQQAIAFLHGQKQEVQKRIEELVDNAPEAQRTLEALTGLKGIGQKCALHMVADVDVLAFESGQQLACFWGMSPKLNQSGAFQGQTRITRCGDRSARSDFYLAAQAAMRFNPYFRDFGLRLITRGLRPKQAILAVARKLVIVCWAIARRAIFGLPYTYPTPALT